MKYWYNLQILIWPSVRHSVCVNITFLSTRLYPANDKIHNDEWGISTFIIYDHLIWRCSQVNFPVAQGSTILLTKINHTQLIKGSFSDSVWGLYYYIQGKICNISQILKYLREACMYQSICSPLGVVFKWNWTKQQYWQNEASIHGVAVIVSTYPFFLNLNWLKCQFFIINGSLLYVTYRISLYNQASFKNAKIWFFYEFGLL